MARRTRIDALIDQWEPVLRARFLEAMQSIRNEVQLSVITELLAAGNIEGAVRAVNLDPVMFRPLDLGVSQAFEVGGVDAMARLPKLRSPEGFELKARFDVRAVGAESYLRTNSSVKITAITEDTRVVIREHLTKGMEAGRGPGSVALDLVGRIDETGNRSGGVIGMTSTQAEWSRNYADELSNPKAMANALNRDMRDKKFDGVVKRAIETGEPIPADQQRAMVAAYRNRATYRRGEDIGRTEAMGALHQGAHEAFQQAIDKGVTKKENVTRVWHTAHDVRVRKSHRDMDKQTVAFDEPFVTPDGVEIRYPGDRNAPPGETINCRCWVENKIDFLADIE